MLEGVYTGRERFGGIVRENGAGGLEDDFTLIVALVNVVDGYPGELFMGIDNGLVHRGAIVPFAPVFGE